MQNVLCVFIGLICGYLISTVFWGLWASGIIFGTLKSKIDEDGEEYLFLAMDKHPNELRKRKFVIFRTDLDNKNSQE